MKKITLLLLFLFISMSGYSQLSLEGFENTTGTTTTTLPTTWLLGTGTWSVFEKNSNASFGSGQSWGINAFASTTPYAGSNCASVNREQINQGNTSEDYLSTPPVLIPTNGELHFYTRMGFSGNQGTVYQIKIAPSTATPSDPAAYTTVAQQWTEADLILPTTNYNVYTEKTVDLSAFAGQTVYVSFVKIFTQPLGILDGDRWLIDNVSINTKCLVPTGLTFSALTATTANLNWTNPSGATSWEIEVIPSTGTPTGVGTVYNGALPYQVTGLTPNTDYKYYVRALCSTGYSSVWSVPSSTFTTSTAPPGCGGNYVDPGGPTANYPNNSNVTTTVCPTTPGDVVTVTFTSFAVSANDFLKIYDGNNASAPLLANLTGTTLPPSYTSSATTGCLTFVFTSNANTNNTGFITNITCAPPPTCRKPTAFATSLTTSNSVTLNWTQPVNPDTTTATSWEVLALPCGSVAPTATATGGVIASTNTNYLLSGLTSATCYDIYVRAVCSATDSSAWTGPATITTLVAPPVCGGNFVDSGGIAGDYANNANNTTTPIIICPTIAGNVVTVTFTSFNTEATYDGLYVYDGNTVNPATLIPSTNGAGNVPGGLAGSYWGTTIPGPFTASNASGCLTFVFRSDGSGTRPGWVSNITCTPAPSCARPATFTTSTLTHNSVVLNWTQPANPDTSVASAWQVLALPCGSAAPTATSTGFINVTTAPPYTLTGLSPQTCYDIYVRAVCSGTDSSTWTSPRSLTTLIAPAVCGGTFVDLGGNNASYPINANDVRTICPITAGDVVTVTFSIFNTESTYDGLYVYDGNTVNPTTLLASTNGAGNVPGGLAGSYWGNLTGANIPGPFTATNSTGCLTFAFRSDDLVSNAGWVANVTCAPPPTCLRPNLLTATNITATSALLGWTDTNVVPATKWEVLVLPFGSPLPLPNAIGIIVSANPSLITGLNPATKYTFYVRSVCSTTDSSSWSVGFDFQTLIINDDCSGAIFAPVNSSAVCQQIASGTLTGATASTGITSTCIGNANDDVWFQFIASNSYLNVSLQNVVGSTTNLNFGVFSGQCGTLTQKFCSTANNLSGVLNNLVVGQTYYIRVYSNSAAAQTVTFDLCISTPSTCSTGSTVCSLTNYGNTTGVTSLGTIGCLGSSPNPAYFTVQVATTGPINFTLTQSTTMGGTPNLDVDYAAWGPFTSQSAACTAISGGQAPGIGVPVTVTTGCSFSADPIEYLNIVNAVAGQYYIVLITNYSDDPGYINLTQTNSNSPGAGTTNCCPDAYFKYTPSAFCRSAGTPNPTPTIDNGSLAGTFSSTPGLVFVDSSTNTGSLTGQINILASTAGNYLITNTVAPTATCGAFVKTYTINITEPSSATIAYSDPVHSTYCQSITTLQTVTQTGTTGGNYSANPPIGLSINPNTGDINPSLSSPGIYTVIYGPPGSICTTGNASTIVEILALPNIAQPAPVTACNTYTLPTLAVGNYYSQSGGVSPIDPTLPITSSQTIYIYAMGSNGCPNEKSFPVTINSVPTPTISATTPSACATPTGAVTVLTPTGTTAPIPTNLFISEVTDAAAGSLTYVEIYNGTGAPVNLANYKLRFYTTVTGAPSCDLVLSGTLANNTTNVIKVSGDANITGVFPNQTFTLCSGVNYNDNIRLTTSTNTLIDLWGRIDGVTFTPNGQAGYTYRRLSSATLPSTTWNPADWTAIDPEDYTNLGTYSLATSNYQYSIDNGVTYQAGTTFTGLAAGNHILIVKDLVTGCLSAPLTVVIDATDPTPSVAEFGYATPVCKDASNPQPNYFAPGFTTGGTYSEVTTVSTGLVFANASTGEIDLVNSTTGSHTIRYTVGGVCVAVSSFDFTIVINPVITPVIGFSYSTTSICKNAQATLTPIAPGLSSFAQFSVTPTTGLAINASTGVIDVANSTPGNYSIIVTVPADSSSSVCRLAATTATPILLEIKPVVTLVTGFNYDTPLCQFDNNGNIQSPHLNTGFATGGAFSSTTGLSITTSGDINLSASTPGTYTVTYTPNPNTSLCEVGTPSTAPVTIVAPVTIELTGGCQSVSYILTATPVNGSFVPETATYSWQNAQGIVVGTTQSITVPAVGDYTVTVTVAGCSTKSQPFNVPSISCVIQKGISVNNDGLNDTFDLTGYDVKKLTIFNRLGMKVYTKANYVNEWGGKDDNGDELPDGTYYYIIEKNVGETKTGWIYINRAQ